MKSAINLTPNGLRDFLLGVAPSRPVFIWGPPGIGKSAIVEQFAAGLGMECVSLLGSQLAPEDVVGVPKVEGDVTRFFPPASFKRDREFVLFLDELNGCSQEIQRAFYSLIHEKRAGEYRLPKGTIVIAAGNRAEDAAIVRPVSSALINRMVHVHLSVSAREWLAWAGENGIHPWVVEYIQNRPDHVWVKPPKTEEPFSTPRSWHMLSDCLFGFGDGVTDENVALSALGCVTQAHAVQFRTFSKLLRNKFGIAQILKGDARWPSKPEERDLLYFLAQSFRAHLAKTLPRENAVQTGSGAKDLAHKAKGLVVELAGINFEIAQMVMGRGDSEDEALPPWFMAEVVRDLPRLVERRGGG